MKTLGRGELKKKHTKVLMHGLDQWTCGDLITTNFR